MNWTQAAMAAGVLAALYGYRRFSLWMWPNRPCWWCKGKGRNFGSNRRRWGRCWFCHGRPRRRRGARK
jgi:hypothetical protein